MLGIVAPVCCFCSYGLLAPHNSECLVENKVLHKSSSETLMLEEAYGKATMIKAQVYEWHKHFHCGRTSWSTKELTAKATSTEGRYQNTVSRNAFNSYVTVGESMPLSKGATPKVMLYKQM
jgi:hypothetical protein